MKKNIVIVSSTPRKDGNSDILAEEFARGAKEAGHNVKKINIREIELKFCIGCMSCMTSGKCVINDSMNSLYEPIKNADVLVFATPVYYYEMSGQLKTFLDRLNPLYSQENKFRQVYVIATSAEDDRSAMDGVESGIGGWIACFPSVKLEGIVYGTGLTDVGEARGSKAAVEAYEMGKFIS